MKSNVLSALLLGGIAFLALHSCRESNITSNTTSSPSAQQTAGPANTLSYVPLAGNSFITRRNSSSNAFITDTQLENWSSTGTVISTYFRVSNSGSLNIGLRAAVPNGSSVIKVSVGNVSQSIRLSGSNYKNYTVKSFNISSPGYVQVDLQGLSKTDRFFANVSDISFSGTAATGKNIFSDTASYYYWSRRGPSCHLYYTIPTNDNISYYYNEVKVPIGQDNIGSYFMVNGFGEGYFGMQVNSASERKIIFSVWSPFSTNDPKKIPPGQQIKLNRAGSNVVTGVFGNEGAGGQSYYPYNWIAGETYKFLLKGEPEGNGNTNYTAWFLPPNTPQWKLIASWKRPKTNTYLTRFHSFLENFNAENGYLGRKVEYKNQWVRTTSGQWIPIASAYFTVDNTYNDQQRIDAIGGITGNSFFLQNGGFFNTIVPPNTSFSIVPPSKAPNINLSTLP
ncbi:DUF3472 domain-containing protein [Elizabethkingia argentiflava]|uniref:DUF3472 domain-containing protein n=1 Tax=Elizabethkingia argenteiflava TaxID=2681556 RepID=A0A845PW81_9FLAO|nr:DUF3472 domain-containing protein [Elizabethkingia argenteiflava]NAW51126.1 DUF3472 domain-containing protein [Elizabethkingia argenteiflava]